mmetsp:Transcript_47423/g.88334  ORF Transcript_47423/g.88334 Transcript_47423/m.88334 type:complete len:289 (+) Transcript_47423:1071-1937(+)
MLPFQWRTWLSFSSPVYFGVTRSNAVPPGRRMVESSCNSSKLPCMWCRVSTQPSSSSPSGHTTRPQLPFIASTSMIVPSFFTHSILLVSFGSFRIYTLVYTTLYVRRTFFGLNALLSPSRCISFSESRSLGVGACWDASGSEASSAKVSGRCLVPAQCSSSVPCSSWYRSIHASGGCGRPCIFGTSLILIHSPRCSTAITMHPFVSTLIISPFTVGWARTATCGEKTTLYEAVGGLADGAPSSIGESRGMRCQHSLPLAAFAIRPSSFLSFTTDSTTFVALGAFASKP